VKKLKNLNIPLGSQHVALLEPLRLEFNVENEKINDVNFDFGYVHRGIEKACTEKFGYKQVGYVVARVCGLCAITHSTAYTLAIESLLNLEVTKKIKYLRMLVLELDRIHSHMLCLSHTAENAGYEALFMQTMRDRELVMNIQDRLTGNRVQFDYISIGGVNRDLTGEVASFAKENLDKLRVKILELKELFLTNPTLSLRYKGIGAITKEQSKILSVTGPLARASGDRIDIRENSNFLYKEVGFKLITGENGDIFDRNIVRLEEILNSIEICENILDNLPEGEIFVKPKGRPNGEAFISLEAPRGELFYYVKAEKKEKLSRLKIKTPTYSNIPAMIDIFKGQNYANVPAILASFDPCLSCTAK